MEENLSHVDRLENLIRDYDRDSRERIDRLDQRYADMIQMVANVSYIFRPEGPFVKMEDKVERFSKYENGITALLAVGGVFGIGALWAKARAILHL